MAKTNAERVKAWRDRQMANPVTADAYRRNRAELARDKAARDKAEREELQAELEELRRLVSEYANDSRQNTAVGLGEENWERLRTMDGRELRQWVMAGQAMDRKGHDNPIENSIAWVEGNRLTPRG